MEVREKNWHNLSVEDTVKELNTRVSGLTLEEVKQRLLQYGPNELKAQKKTSIIVVFLKQFLNPLIYVLVVAAIISLAAQFFTAEQHYIDAIVIFGVIILNATIGTLQETSAEKAMEALKELAAPKARIRRNGNIETIPAREIVPGDIILFESGDKIPADVRLIESANLKANESALTGESMPVEKHTTVVPDDSGIADRENMLFMGTIITNGRATGLAVLTGMSTEMGKIATGLEEVKPEETPLQKNIKSLSRYLVFVFLGVSLLLIAVGLLQGLGLLDVLLLAIAAAVASIPEGLPAVVTVVLAIGMRAMARRNAIIRKLVAVETLGSATVICSDKTGTLTLNQMTVRRVYLSGHSVEVTGEGYEPHGEFIQDGHPLNAVNDSQLGLLLKIGALCNDSVLVRNDVKPRIIGDPTEGALVVAAAKAGFEKETLEHNFPRVEELAFESEKRYMATMHAVNGRYVVYVKGAIEKILAFSKYQLRANQVVPLDNQNSNLISEAAGTLAREALRVIAMAYLDLPRRPQKLTDEIVTQNLTFVGLAAMEDPPRDEAKQSVALSRQAGIKVIMITGDNKITAESIARQIGFPEGKAISGAELQKMSDIELANEIENVSVFARIEPLHKLRIVNALKKKNYVVAMTGDGVNDAPAIKAADIGISMGITGTDVAKEASDMVLADDNFASVVAAVDEGRVIFNRLRNVLFYTLNTNFSELITLILALIFVGQSPLLAVQILWVNLVTDTAGDIPLGFEPKVGDELTKPPRDPGIGLMYPGLFIRIMVMASIIGLGTFLIFRWAEYRFTVEEARTMAFCAMVAFEWFMAFSARSDEHTVFQLGIFRNRILVASIGLAVILQLAVVYVPFLQVAFDTYPLNLRDWGIILLSALAVFALEEIRKALFPKLYSVGKYQRKVKIPKT
jgi:P-type Ca2+ transporter type 2C